ncbi:hypothetical protein KL919_001366 [Ogataea angusta]|nr:hypothetical protein KL909_004846 [Ogataea angusta]KAG7838682.1 hypothetical protein KL943_000758 [Ogataea angusta]KAG7860982.1 hypothetical protein KL939_001549 [Ogataea angusta]KAG7862236.1 hypothetical protein KL919_001366 [Ogataea angusta]
MSVVTTTLIQNTNGAPEAVIAYISKVVKLWEQFIRGVEKVPGGSLVLNYIRASHKNDPWRTLLEVLLALVAIRYFFASKYSQDEKEKVHLSEREVQELIDDWEPEPFAPPLRKEERWELDAIPMVKGAAGNRVALEDPKTGNIIPNLLNMASRDFLNMGLNENVKQRAIKTIRECGVGACNPMNFYGTQDVHVRLGEDLARFLGAEEGIIYGQDYCTSTSVLPCFLKRGDIVIVDGGVSVALQKAALISRCHIEWFNHNDLDHLEEILESLQEDLREGPLNRRFIVTEALSENFGDSPDLKRLVEIKNKYKFRLYLDETYSIGTLGSNGRGLPEVYGIPRSEIEITVGSLAHAFGSSGGFCVGCRDMAYYQVLSSNAYVFSAALPPYSASAASAVISMLEEAEEPGKVNRYVKPLQDNTKLLYSLLKQSRKLQQVVSVRSAEYSPVLILRLAPALRKKLNLPESYGGPGSDVLKAIKNGHEEGYFSRDYNRENYLLQKMIDELIGRGVLVTRSKRVLHHELLPVVPTLLINVNAGFTEEDIRHAYECIEDTLWTTLSGLDADGLNQLVQQLEETNNIL